MMTDTTISTTSDSTARAANGSTHVCPWWLGPLLASPIRRLIESPERLLQPFVKPGMTVVEPGCGMGYFTIPLARLVGPAGRVVAFDLQPRMVAGLRRRARRARLADRVRVSVSSGDFSGVEGLERPADLAVVLHMLHEVPDQRGLLQMLYGVLRPGGLLLVVEPKGHVSADDFGASIATARRVGFDEVAETVRGRGPTALLRKPDGPGPAAATSRAV